MIALLTSYQPAASTSSNMQMAPPMRGSCRDFQLPIATIKKLGSRAHGSKVIR